MLLLTWLRMRAEASIENIISCDLCSQLRMQGFILVHEEEKVKWDSTPCRGHVEEREYGRALT
jgi:hypothetical protein